MKHPGPTPQAKPQASPFVRQEDFMHLKGRQRVIADLLYNHTYQRDGVWNVGDQFVEICHCGYKTRSYVWYPDWVVHISEILLAALPSEQQVL